jgi:NADPH:quinone reductase-like Zn-dependent oxidoreductase/acyl dehydratase
MKAIICSQYGGPDLLELIEIATPEIGADQVLIDVHFCGVNFPDTLIIQNKYQFKPPLPFSPGGEIAGIVTQIGLDVKNCKVGDRVMALCGWGGMAEQVSVKASHVFLIPPALDLFSASICMYTFGTAIFALKNKAQLKADQTILILGAAGGVGSAAIMLAKLMGAKVIAAASNNEKLAYCKLIGADETINYTTENLKGQIKEITSNIGVDIVFDTIGGPLAAEALKSVAWNGHYLIIGFASGVIPQIPFNLALLKGCSLHGIFWGAFAEKESKANRENFIQIIQWMLEGKLKQHIHQIYSLEDAPKAIADMVQRKINGKAIIQIKAEQRNDSNKQNGADKNVITHSHSVNTSPKLIINGKDAINQFIGNKIGPGKWFTITQKIINDFASTTQDYQWVHIDEVKAAQYLPEGKTVAHGYLTMSLVSHLLYELIELKNVKAFYNYGLNKARFISPVKVNSNIRLTAILEKAEVQANGSIKLFLQCTIEIEGIEKPAYVAEIISIIN